MSGTYPSEPEFQAINVSSRHNNLFSEALSGRVQVRSLGGQRWAFTARYNRMTRQEFQPVFAFVTSQQGRLGSFGIVPPVIGSTSGDATGTARVNGTTPAGETSVPVDGFTGSIKAGDFVKFNHGKVYMVTEDRSGPGNISIEPALVTDVADDEQMVYNDVTFTMRLDNDVQEYDLNASEQYEYQVDMVEVI
jgi:hypothetical protein